MTPEEQAAADAVQRHQTDSDFLRAIGLALEAESARRRGANEAAMTTAEAASFVASLSI